MTLSTNDLGQACRRIEEIQERVDRASPGPWEKGEVWACAVLRPERFGSGGCAFCARMGAPVWEGVTDFFGQYEEGHVHKDPDPPNPGHGISSSEGGLVAGNYDGYEGGILEPEDTEFIAHAREDIPALLAFANNVLGLGDGTSQATVRLAAERHLGGLDVQR